MFYLVGHESVCIDLDMCCSWEYQIVILTVEAVQDRDRAADPGVGAAVDPGPVPPAGVDPEAVPAAADAADPVVEASAVANQDPSPNLGLSPGLGRKVGANLEASLQINLRKMVTTKEMIKWYRNIQRKGYIFDRLSWRRNIVDNLFYSESDSSSYLHKGTMWMCSSKIVISRGFGENCSLIKYNVLNFIFFTNLNEFIISVNSV